MLSLSKPSKIARKKGKEDWAGERKGGEEGRKQEKEERREGRRKAEADKQRCEGTG